VIVSTRQRMPKPLGGEENVYASWANADSAPFKQKIDINGRWTDRLGASVAEDGSWVRFYLTEPSVRPGPSPARRHYYTPLAYVELRTGELVRSDLAHSTKEEREGEWFRSTPELAPAQTVRGHAVAWRPCK
jgi:hypothetical protein